MFVVEIGGPVLQDDAQRADRALADEPRIEVPAQRARCAVRAEREADRRIAADEADHVAERFRMPPRDRPGSDRAARRAADRAAFWIIGEPPARRDRGQQLVERHPAIIIGQRVIFLHPVIRIVHAERVGIVRRAVTGGHEDAERWRNRVLQDQRVEDRGDPERPCRIRRALSILEHQQIGRAARIIAWRDIDPVAPHRAGKALRVEFERAGQRSPECWRRRRWGRQWGCGLRGGLRSCRRHGQRCAQHGRRRQDLAHLRPPHSVGSA